MIDVEFSRFTFWIGKQAIGFLGGSMDKSVVMEEVKRTFQPEFRNRLNRIVAFNGMDDDMADRIARKKLNEMGGLLREKRIDFRFDDAAVKLVKKKGISTEYGAREIDRVIRNDIKPLFVDEILFGRLKTGGDLALSAENGEFCERTDHSLVEVIKKNDFPENEKLGKDSP